MTNQPKNCAIIGVGAAKPGGKGGGHQIGYLHATAYGLCPRARLVAAADINAENLRAFQENFSGTRGFSNHREMLQEIRPEIVSICTYVGLHRRMIEDCVDAGVKGIFCEKPFVASPADLRAVGELVERSGVKICVAHFRRYYPSFQRMKELYAGGAIGQPLMCIAGIEGWDLSEWGSHWLDMFRFFHEPHEVRWVFCQARVRQGRGYGHAMEDHASAYFGFDDGGKAMLDGGTGMNGPWTMCLLGTEGVIRLQEEHLVVMESTEGRRTQDFKDHPEMDMHRAWQQATQDLCAWLDGGPVPIIGLPRVFKTAELNLACYLSAIKGDRIDLPLVDFEVAEWPVELLARRRA